MYIVERRELIDANEPQLGYITESVLFEEDGEGRQLFIRDMVNNQERIERISTPDSVSNEEIELYICDYFTDYEIETLDSLFQALTGWSEVQIVHILLCLKEPCDCADE